MEKSQKNLTISLLVIILLVIGGGVYYYINNLHINNKNGMEQNDILNIAQKILDLPALETYWHPEIEGRKPLVIMISKAMKSKPALFKFDSPVVYGFKFGSSQMVYGGEELLDSKKAFFEFKYILITGNQADVKFAYAVEGIVGEAQLEKNGIVWEVTDSTVSEN